MPPDPRLAGILTRECVGFRHEGSPGARWIEPPRPALTLIVTLQGQLRAGGRALPRTWIGGISDAHDVVEIDGEYECLDLKLSPLGAYTLLAMPLGELGGGVHALDEVLGAVAAAAISARSFAARSVSRPRPWAACCGSSAPAG